jgi:hypothetical protein
MTNNIQIIDPNLEEEILYKKFIDNLVINFSQLDEFSDITEFDNYGCISYKDKDYFFKRIFISYDSDVDYINFNNPRVYNVVKDNPYVLYRTSLYEKIMDYIPTFSYNFF